MGSVRPRSGANNDRLDPAIYLLLIVDTCICEWQQGCHRRDVFQALLRKGVNHHGDDEIPFDPPLYPQI